MCFWAYFSVFGQINISGKSAWKYLITEYDLINVYTDIPEANINYLIDDVTMNLMEENNTWEEEANISINEIRKSYVTFNSLFQQIV